MAPAPAGDLRERLGTLLAEALAELSAAATPDALEELRVRYLGRKGRITRELHGVAALSPAERPAAGEAANRVKAELAEALEARRAELAEALETRRLAAEGLDLTLPGRMPRVGLRHPLSLALEQLQGIFREMGFEVAGGPEVETPYHNFTALNIPEDHPAREESDTIFVEGGLLLRTHTSPVQIQIGRAHV